MNALFTNLPEAPMQECVLESSVMLLRNYADLPFCQSLSDTQAEELISRVDASVLSTPDANAYTGIRFGEDTAVDIAELRESRCIDETEPINAEHCAILLSSGKTLSVMVAAKEHLHIRSRLPGLQLERCLQMALPLVQSLAQPAPYAYTSRFGYATSTPLLAGTGLLCRATLHLPMLEETKKIHALIGNLLKKNLALRPLLSQKPATIFAAPASMYTLENLATIGQTEEEILCMVEEATAEIVSQELALREQKHADDLLSLVDRFSRNLAILGSCHILPLPECTMRLSTLRLGSAMSMYSTTVSQIDTLMPLLLNASLSKAMQGEKSVRALDIYRAKQAREIARSISCISVPNEESPD